MPFLKIASVYGATINTWLALFNMIPFGMFDGKKILRWNKIIYGVMVAIGIILLLFTQSAMTY
ncbi:hypothetical protein HN419_04415 [Candidatus Woesearchaeota archaeon]|jgi:Zn-dependent protease|nr:hypothetical protein [Candidatus Woesearchaeota archaeon]MBT3537878.1 hypothetical protein [Candidatus Woesearchaeota archaeon]MBT4698009.1 hypothetical protein [Candidatus Woesearchaeota archaeon]MBT4716598.1 hypothetical protein [Candidatus Woesearchaeota archaeon]MBT7105547.1 hypothetical protein [Candidatus Woesearchaeota archaeon]